MLDNLFNKVAGLVLRTAFFIEHFWCLFINSQLQFWIYWKTEKCAFNIICYLHKIYLQRFHPSSDVSSVWCLCQLMYQCIDTDASTWNFLALPFLPYFEIPCNQCFQLLGILGSKTNKQTNKNQYWIGYHFQLYTV